MISRISRRARTSRRAEPSRCALSLILTALLAAPAGHALIQGCPEDQDAILRSMRLLRGSAAKKVIMDALGACLSVPQVVNELRLFQPSPAHSRAFRELAARGDITEKDARAILDGSHTLTSMRTRQAVILDLIGKANRKDLLRTAGTLPGPLLKEVLQRLVEVETLANDPPVPQDQSLQTSENTPIEIRLRTNETGYMSFEVGQPEHGTLSGVGGSPDTVKYQPDKGFAGFDSFQFKASDGQLDSTEKGTVTIRVRPSADDNR